MEGKQGDKKGTRSLAEILSSHRDVFGRARAVLPSLPEGGRRGAPPATLADAVAQIQERQQNQQAAKDPKSKAKSAPAQPAEQAVPGALIGGSVPNSAFWTLVEVRRARPAEQPACLHGCRQAAWLHDMTQGGHVKALQDVVCEAQ